MLSDAEKIAILRNALIECSKAHGRLGQEANHYNAKGLLRDRLDALEYLDNQITQALSATADTEPSGVERRVCYRTERVMPNGTVYDRTVENTLGDAVVEIERMSKDDGNDRKHYQVVEVVETRRVVYFTFHPADHASSKADGGE